MVRLSHLAEVYYQEAWDQIQAAGQHGQQLLSHAKTGSPTWLQKVIWLSNPKPYKP